MTNRSLVILSGEGTTLPKAEAKSLFLTYDPGSKFESPSPQVLIAESGSDPFLIGTRIAFARRVGVLIDDLADARSFLKGHRFRFRSFALGSQRPSPEPREYLGGVEGTVDLRSPEYELTLVRADQDYLAITSPRSMMQGWSRRRPRSRPFFHPSVIFPKLSRALVNLSRCRAGDLFLDPFAGTGSLPIEASLVGARVVAVDQTEKMARGALANMKHFHQEWLGSVRADSTRLPLAEVDSIATDVPYGRASSTRGRVSGEIVNLTLPVLSDAMKQGSTLVLMHQKEVQVDGEPHFLLAEEHDLYVHKLMTRTISILRRR